MYRYARLTYRYILTKKISILPNSILKVTTLNKSRLGRKNSLKGCTEDLFGRQEFGLDLTHKAVKVIIQRKTRIGFNDTGACPSLSCYMDNSPTSQQHLGLYTQVKWPTLYSVTTKELLCYLTIPLFTEYKTQGGIKTNAM